MDWKIPSDLQLLRDTGVRSIIGVSTKKTLRRPASDALLCEDPDLVIWGTPESRRALSGFILEIISFYLKGI